MCPADPENRLKKCAPDSFQIRTPGRTRGLSGGGSTLIVAIEASPESRRQAKRLCVNSRTMCLWHGDEGEVVSGAAQQNFTVLNNTGHTVMTLNVSASNDDNWGPDILGADVIANGQSAEVSFERGEAQCLWDIRATYDDGDTTDLRGVNLCEVGTVTLTAS